MRKKPLFCETCDRVTVHQDGEVSHILHLLLSLITVGCWLPIWFLIVIARDLSRLRCASCGMVARRR